jgi:hypothetical protein
MRCACCGVELERIPTDYGYWRPVPFFMVPEAERPQRVKVNDDLCVIDDSLFYVRGIMEVPIIGGPPGARFGWGLWVAVSERSFARYRELWDVDGSDEPPFRGLLAVSPIGYPDLLDAEVRVQLRSATERPLILPAHHDHPLFVEQRDGISVKRWLEIVATIVAAHRPASA